MTASAQAQIPELARGGGALPPRQAGARVCRAGAGRIPICETRSQPPPRCWHRSSRSAGRIGILSANRPGVVFTVHAATRMAFRSCRSTGVRPLKSSRGSCGMPASPCWSSTRNERRWRSRLRRIMPVDDRADRRAGALWLRQAGSPDAVLRIDLEREATVIYTSGTSGRPKGCSHHLWQPLVRRSRLRAPPRSSPGGCLAGGDALVPRRRAGHPLPRRHRRSPGSPARAISARSALAAIDDGVTLLSVVPTMLQRLLEARGDAILAAELALRPAWWERGAAATRRGVRSSWHPRLPRRTD